MTEQLIFDIYSQILEQNTDILNSNIQVLLSDLLNESQSHFQAHPLGFIYIRFPIMHNFLRLHIWPRGKRARQEPFFPIHNHIYDFTSYVLLGPIRNIVYRISELATGAHQLFSVEYLPESSNLIPTKKSIAIQVSDDNLIQAGHFYQMAQAQFHESIVDEDSMTVTLLSTCYTTQKTPFVVGDALQKDLSFKRKPPVDIDHKDVLNKVIMQLT
jgi:hypothetical protein